MGLEFEKIGEGGMGQERPQLDHPDSLAMVSNRQWEEVQDRIIEKDALIAALRERLSVAKAEIRAYQRKEEHCIRHHSNRTSQ